MCKKLKILCISILLICLSLFPHSVSAAEFISSTYPANSIIMTTSQYNTLKHITSELQMQCSVLQIRLQQLKQNSAEQAESLNVLSEELKSCKEELYQTQELLTSAKIDLIAAKNYLAAQKVFIKTLREEINALERTNKRLKKQRQLYVVLAAGLGVVAFVK